MFDKLFSTFFTKKKKVKMVKTYIKFNRKNNIKENNRNVFYGKYPEKQETCLSGYFKNNKGLNVIERTAKLCVATIEA